MYLGVSAIAVTVTPLTSTPSISPESTWKTSAARQWSLSAPIASDAVHGHTTSHEQFSKYRPSMLHAMRTPPG